MRKIPSLFIVLITAYFLITSCSVEKRLYTDGYNIKRTKFNSFREINKSQKSITRKINDIFQDSIELVFKDTTETQSAFSSDLDYITASISKSDICVRDINKSPVSFLIDYIEHVSNVDSCDNIILKNGDEIPAKIIEINPTEVKYKKCDYINGPTVVLEKSKVFMIKYANGTKDVFSSENTNENQKKSEVKEKRLSAIAVLSFLLGLIGIIASLSFSMIVGICLGILASIIGMFALIDLYRNSDKVKGGIFAVFGIILGLTVIILSLLL